ncbi:protein TolB-like [Hordeum vulgare]|nr:protein TolB-like [Hordeum vulgare]
MARRAELLFLLPAILLLLLLSATPALSAVVTGTIVFTMLGRSRYAFDVFALPLALASSLSLPTSPAPELRLTDGASVNYNGNFAPSSDALLFVSERNGSLNIYLSPAPLASSSRRVALQLEEEYSPPPTPRCPGTPSHFGTARPSPATAPASSTSPPPSPRPPRAGAGRSAARRWALCAAWPSGERTGQSGGGAAAEESEEEVGERSLRRRTAAMARSSAGMAGAASEEARRSVRGSA